MFAPEIGMGRLEGPRRQGRSQPAERQSRGQNGPTLKLSGTAARLFFVSCLLQGCLAVGSPLEPVFPTTSEGSDRLTGTGPDVASKQLAEQTVARVENVKSVANQLEVASPRSFSERTNDILIASKVKATLADAKDLSAPAFKVVTQRGTVYLMGFV